MNTLLVINVFFPMICAVLSYLIGRFKKEARDYFADGVTILTFASMLCLWISLMTGRISEGMSISIPNICGMGLSFTLDGFRALYGTIAAFMWMMSTLFSKEYFAHYHNRNRYYLFLLLTLGATLGVFLSADFYTTFIFFEIMSFTSYVWVAHDERVESLRAAGTYLAVAVIGGLVMLMGIFLLYSEAGTLRYEELVGYVKEAVLLSSNSHTQTKLWAAGVCMFFGFGAKAGAFPLYIWLPKAHPVAPAPASALLSGILTKAGVYGGLILSCYLFLGIEEWGAFILIIGVCTMVVGAVLAVFSIDLKRTLASSSVSQIGFILVGVGMAGLLQEENGLALRGALLHMVNHSLIKLVLFMAAGVVFMNVHKLDLNEIKGFGRKKPLLNGIFLMGALGIGGIPLWNGYISKTLIHESIVEYTELIEEGVRSSMFSAQTMKTIEWIFLISGGMTVAYMTKLYVAVFVEKNNDQAVQEKFDACSGSYMNKTSAFALTVSAILLPLMGFFPGKVMNSLADMGESFLHTGESEPVAYFALANLKGGGISILLGIIIYFVVIRLWLIKKDEKGTVYLNRWNPYLDLENLIYRPILLGFLPFVCGVVCRVLDSFVDAVVVLLRKTIYKDSPLPHELEEGTRLTHILGKMANALEGVGNATYRKAKKSVDYEHKFALIYEELTEDRFIIWRSMSFGLFLFCVGLLITVAYLLLFR